MTVLDLIPRTEKETLKFRLLAVLVVAFAFLLRADEVSILPTLSLVLGYLAYSYLLRIFLIPRFTSYPLLGTMLLIDVGTIIAALHVIGLDSPIFGLLPIVVVYYAVYLGYAGGISAAIGSSAGYTGLAFATGQASEVENILAFQPFFYILALLVGYITQQRFRETQERQSLQQLIAAEANAKSLLDLAQALNRVMDPTALSRDISRIGALVARVPYCAIFIHNPETSSLVLQGSNLPDGSPSRTADEWTSDIEGPGNLLSTAWATGKVEFWNGPSSEGDGDAPWLGTIGARRALASPLSSNGENIGVVCFIATTENPEFDEGTQESVGVFSEMAGRILASTQLYSQAERRSRRVASELQQSIETAGRFRELSQRKNLRFGALIIDPGRGSVRWQDTTLRLTKTEFDLLYVLAEKSGSVVNQETLIREVWGQDYVPQGKVADVTVHRLRRRLANLPDGKRLIQTVRGQGYTFVPPERFAGAA